MKERPIIFSAPMVRAILDGRKTQTRRVAKEFAGKDNLDAILRRFPNQQGCPHGEPGDRLWVRESFWGCDAPGFGDQPCVVYDDEWHGKEYRPAEIRPWARKFGRIPAIHMPRDCSRITLEITGVRVERLHGISEQDAVAEGIDKTASGFWSTYGQREVDGTFSPRSSFQSLWESINGPFSWEANPWVWVIEFARITDEAGGGS
ncbi:hypothetical protein [Burkholderia glumae]|uniref:hypothetical protein n=1 Tax=Burkholderia glumae TaxID=337 RepID=UPI00054AD985|nr:hypothetical protein [Burkholderia glumae]KHJ64703.1 hypothetical protein NCPPB3923_01640 [Burkholderia glumae]